MLPGPFQPANTASLHNYQGILIVEVALTLLVYLVLQVVHYIKWGHEEEQSADKPADRKPDEDQSSKKWDMRKFNLYFPIIFANHVASIALIIAYIPFIFSAVIGFLHFACFVALVIINIFIKDLEEGKGSRTNGTRVLWGIMCLFNVMLIIGGLSGVANVLT